MTQIQMVINGKKGTIVNVPKKISAIRNKIDMLKTDAKILGLKYIGSEFVENGKIELRFITLQRFLE